jgi:hypothetical protein
VTWKAGERSLEHREQQRAFGVPRGIERRSRIAVHKTTNRRNPGRDPER